MLSTFTAFLDADVFTGARLRSLVLAGTGLFRARRSEAVHDEWTRNLLTNRPDLRPEDLARTCRLMNGAVLDAVVAGYEPLIPALDLPDPDDRHVLAAAIHGRASCIVTFDLGSFPPDRLAPFGLHAVHPDDFLLDVEGLDPVVLAGVIADDLPQYRAPPLRTCWYKAG